MRINGKGTTEFDATVLDEGAAFTFLTEACCFDLQNRLAGKAIIDFSKINVARSYSCNFVCSRRAEVEADFENIGAIRDVVRWERVSGRDSHHVHWRLTQISGALSGGHEQRRRTVGFQATIQESVG